MSEFVGARLALARAFKHVTLKKLADTVSVSFSLLGHYEKGLRKNPRPDLVAALASALDVQPRFFFESLDDPWREEQCSFRKRASTPEGIKRRAERHGVILIKHLCHADKIDAFSRRGTRSIIVLNTSRTSTSRWIYDVAHELGHFVLHEGIETGSKLTEDQANRFASALLLPRKTFSGEFSARPFSWGHVFALKRRWTASVSAIIRRARDLSLIDAILYRRGYQYMSAKGWLKKEPYEPEFVEPEWLPSAFKVAKERFGVSASALADKLHMTARTFTAVTGESIDRASMRLARACSRALASGTSVAAPSPSSRRRPRMTSRWPGSASLVVSLIVDGNLRDHRCPLRTVRPLARSTQGSVTQRPSTG